MPQYELNINDYLRIVRKRKLSISITVLIVLILSWVYFSSTTPVYEAKATIKIEERKTVAGLLTEWIVYSPADVMESHTRLITSFPVMKKVALKLGMIDVNAPFTKVDTAVSELQGNISTKKIGNTNIIEITATSGEPKKAMDLANTVAEVYIEENLLEKNQQARTTRQFIEDQLAILDTRLKDTEESLRQFGNDVKDIRLSTPIEKKLTDLEFELVTLSQRYTEKHPQIRQIKDQIKDLEAQLKGFSGKELEYARLNREVEVNRKLYTLLKEKLEEARISEAEKIGDVSLVDPAFMPSGAVNQNKVQAILLGGLLGLVLGFIIAFVSESLDTSIGTIEDVESVTKLTVLGVIPSIKGEPKEIEAREKNILNKILIYLFPHKKTTRDEYYVRLIAHYEPKSVVAESYRTIRTNIRLGAGRKTILITSTGPQEGKTTVLVNLGLVIAQTGAKTLLVSTDLRRPAINRTFGLKQELGFAEVVTKAAKLDDALLNISDIMLGDSGLDKVMHTPGMDNIWILPSGRIPTNPAELLESKETDNLISELKQRFDFILFDSPPVLPVTDAALLAPRVDGVIIVYEAGRTAREALLRAKVQIESTGAKVLGVVLNHIRSSTGSLSGYPYYYQYKKYYTDESEKEKKKS
ncbi:MAG: polysaccharide biosynthesis tyrosine autokinase [Candidatus Omnitrophica bacterium]|nr:polysaccharide biosynthesis tyrosine autokinase [Candidatus Omnitrophota bacterium]MDD5236452.1 polysaccharide biosynthesis tyrosine autokinase [Candidatus Omnitrophota bacterium]MDD5610512.1 polysaccharide biosynthesis tyrosine autokinase [Candidatus Omnitrophota bacterium]